MKNTILFTIALFFMAIIGCSSRPAEPIVLIKTNHGNIRVRLYNDTPAHRDNFLKLAQEGFLDSTLFHRVIKHFMIQGGDPSSKGAEASALIGQGGPGYTLPAEIKYPTHFHKRGALAAARQADRENPDKRSSGSQFYIVHGEVFENNKLTQIENQVRDGKRREIFNKLIVQYNDSLNALQQQGNESGMMALQNFVMAEQNRIYTQEPDYTIPEEIKEIYRTIGGAPFLDGGYTVFGEVVEKKTIYETIGSWFGKNYGLEVLDLIAEEQIDARNRPFNNVVMKVKVIKK